MTQEQKDAHLKGGAKMCSYCGHDELDCDRLMLAECEDEYECKTRCLKCRKEWTDVYRVMDVRDHEEDEEEWEEESEVSDG